MNYDVIVIGNTPIGRYLALTAAFWDARAALVTQEISFAWEADWLYHFTLTQLTDVAQKWSNIESMASPPLARYQQWGQEVIDLIQEDNALVKLAAQGVDVIEGKGEFCRLPRQAFLVNHERLQARAYVIAAETVPVVPQVPNLSEVGYLTLTDLKQKQSLDTLPQNLTIIGEPFSAIPLAQNLAKLNRNITVSLADSDLFPTEDQEIRYALKAQLEADGIKVLTDSRLLKIQKIANGKRLQLGNQTLETEELIIVPETKPNVKGLNLEGVRVNYTDRGLIVNQKLQTTNPKIYACGGVIGGYSFFNIAHLEAQIVLKNALFCPRCAVDYRAIPYTLSTYPPLARVGMTHSQAQRRYSNQVVAIKEYFQNSLLNQVQGETTGFLKIIVHQNGKILGGHSFGNNAEELIDILAIAIRKDMTMKQLRSISFISPSSCDLIINAVQQWDNYYYQTHPFWRALRRRYFMICRNWIN